MPRTKAIVTLDGVEEKPKHRPSRPALSPEAQENRMISLAMQLVEKRMLEGTASAQEVVHFLKLGTTNARLEKALLEKEIELKEAKTEALRQQETNEELYKNAIEAMSRYTGAKNVNKDEEEQY
jgi:hypothetical protein